MLYVLLFFDIFSYLPNDPSKHIRGFPFQQVYYQGGEKATVSGVVEDLKFKICEGSDQNWLPGKHQFWS